MLRIKQLRLLKTELFILKHIADLTRSGIIFEPLFNKLCDSAGAAPCF